MTRRLTAIATALMALGAAGCATLAVKESVSPPAAVTSEQQVQTLRERAAAFWAARMEQDPQGEWQLLEPRGKGRMTPEEYASEHKGVRYLGYRVEDAAIAGYFATVKVRVLFQPLLQRLSVAPQSVVLEDHWIRIAGVWYRQMDDRQAPRADR
jgi:hypothetical protein